MSHENAQLSHDYGFLTQELLRLAPHAGKHPSSIPGLTFVRREDPARRESVFFSPSIGIVVQGCKNASIGADEYSYQKGQYLLCCVDMPSSFIVDASPQSPLLTVSLQLDLTLFEEIFREMDADQGVSAVSGGHGASAHTGPERALRVSDIPPDMLHAVARLARLADQPEKARFIAPLLIREIHYYLASGPNGDFLRSFFAPTSQSGQIARAVTYMREHCNERLRIERLARMTNMAESTFNRNFKKVTSLSPLQYHKQLKLYEAKRLMLQERMNAAQACTAVGYESQQQFTREYKRLFGTPPMRDVRQLSRAD